MSDAATTPPEEPELADRAAGRLRGNPTLVGVALAFALLLAIGVVPRVRSRLELQRAAAIAAAARPVVGVTTPHPAPSTDLTLPGTTLPFQQATIYARVDGYLERRLVDIGDLVKTGQLLAVISAPEIDQQLAQAQADLVRQKADLAFARSSLERYEAADREGAVAKEDLDQRRTAVHTAEAAVQAGTATVQRLAEQQRFEHVTAPFDGVVTQRNVDVGALITAGSSSSTTSLFALAQNDVLRVYVNVPQPYVNDIQVGRPAQIRTRSLPGRTFNGSIARSASALDLSTRTMLTEVDIPNADGALKPGMYVQVALQADRVGPRWRIPASAIVFDSKGTQLVIVGPDHKVQVRPVVLGRDFGSEVEVASGLQGDEMLVTTPSASLVDGTLVEPSEPKPEPKP
ncbi:MAG TPA: efflux RND transporter periplasmic adaptor subunit [Myxococcota bacterium]|nr:efflux RND transporter periplasmic adaptor subunit [Myxococcota bacterium]